MDLLQEIEQITQDFIGYVANPDKEKAQEVTNKLVALPSRFREWQISRDLMEKAHHAAYMNSPMAQTEAAKYEEPERPKIDRKKLEKFLSQHLHAGVAPSGDVFHLLMREGYFNVDE